MGIRYDNVNWFKIVAIRINVKLCRSTRTKFKDLVDLQDLIGRLDKVAVLWLLISISCTIYISFSKNETLLTCGNNYISIIVNLMRAFQTLTNQTVSGNNSLIRQSFSRQHVQTLVESISFKSIGRSAISKRSAVSLSSAFHFQSNSTHSNRRV